MCGSCVREHGGPVPVTDAMRAARSAVDAIYATPWGTTGGPLHVIVDDSNVGDEFFTDEDRAKIAETATEWYADSGPDVVPLSHAAFDALRPFTEAQRVTVVNAYLFPELWSL